MIKNCRTNTHNMNYHIVWCTKYRNKIFNSEVFKNDMKDIIKSIIDNNNWELNNIEVLPDHIHILISFPPNHSGSSVMKSIKGASSRIWFKKHPDTKKKLWGGHLWSPSYFISTVGDMSKEVVDQYINNQLTEYNRGKMRVDAII